MEALKRAIEIAGGVTALATRLQLRQSVVSNWLARGQVPPDRCPAVESATGVPCEDLRTDLQWQRDSEGTVTGYVTSISPTSTATDGAEPKAA